METTLDKFGGVVIPKPVREGLGLKAGSTLQIEERDETIIKPVEDEPGLRVKDGVLVFSGHAVGDVAQAVSAHREERVKLLATKRR